MHQKMTVMLYIGLMFIGWSATSRAEAAPSTAGLPSVTFTQIQPRQTIYDWAADTCPDHFFPDAPARAYRRADGKFVLLAEEGDNWQMVGSTPFDLKVSCAPILSSSSYSATTRGSIGIEATYTEDGKTVFGVGGQDLSPLAFANGCIDNHGGSCWLNDLQAVRSSDMGQHFDIVSQNNGDIAAMTHMPENNWKSPEGFFTSSNIFKRAGYYYMFALAQDAYTGHSWNCLLRTSNLADPSSWRGWDGKAFAGVPHPTAQRPAIPIPCAHIAVDQLFDTVQSVNYIPSKGLYIAVSLARLQLAGDSMPISGVYYSTSADLLTWTPVQRLMVLPRVPKQDSMTEADSYPVLIDPFSRTRNFETIDSQYPVLTFTVNHLDQGNGTMNRDVVAVPLMMK